MPLLISPPTTPVVDVNHRVLSNIDDVKKTVLTITAPAIAAIGNILEADATAVLGRKINSINNMSAAPVKIAYGRTVAADDYDYILYGKRQLLDLERNGQFISAMLDTSLNNEQVPPVSATTATIIVNSTKYIEV